MQDVDISPLKIDEWTRTSDAQSPSHSPGPGAARAGLEDPITYDTIVFNDGSTYTGTLKNGVPDGLGTCVWKDGNKYDGEWRTGVMHGFGTYLWTSGQRYDGEWKDGKRAGVGVKRYADGSTFDGFWRDGKKHGVGVFRPAEPGRRPLLRSGSGKLVGPDPRGAPGAGPAAAPGASAPTSPPPGIAPEPRAPAPDFTSSPPALRGSAYDRGSVINVPPEDLAAASVAAAGAGAGAGKDAAARDATADSIVGGPALPPERKVVFIRRFEDGKLVREDKMTNDEIKSIFKDMWAKPKEQRGKTLRRQVRRALGMGKKLQQKQGQLIYKGMPGYDLMIRLQLGIRYSIARMNQQAFASHSNGDLHHHHHHHDYTPAAAAATAAATKIVPSDFTDKAKIFFPAAGSSTTPAHASSDFKWKDYSPKVFRTLRLLWGINDAEYMLALGGSQALRQLNSPGKSGCMFFLSDDEKFLVKTMRKSEIRTLIGMLPQYYRHMDSYRESLVPRFYGVHGVKQVHGRTVRFVVMSNIFNTDVQIHRKFDLKGSTFTRTSGPGVDPNDPKTVFKDLDLDLHLHLPKEAHDRLTHQLAADSEFLASIGVMDYSLLLGVHFVARRRLDEVAAAIAASGGGAGGTGVGQDRENSLAMEDAGPSTHGHARGKDSHAGTSASAAPATPTYTLRTSSDALSQPATPPNGLTPADGAACFSPTGRATMTAGAAAAAAGGGAAGGVDDAETLLAADRARNFDLFTNKEEVARQLKAVEERMRQLNYSEQRIQDVLGLAKLKILGDKLHKGAKRKAAQSRAAGVIKARAQARQDLGGPMMMRPLNEELDEPSSGGSDDELGTDGGHTPLGPYGGVGHLYGSTGGPHGQAGSATLGNSSVPLGVGASGGNQLVVQGYRCPLGYNMPGIAVHKQSLAAAAASKSASAAAAASGGKTGGAGATADLEGGEEVMLCFGIIDILQDYNFRKLLERGFKSVMHDSYAISVAPPKLYASRFLDFMEKQVFPSPLPDHFPLLLPAPTMPRNSLMIMSGASYDSMTSKGLTPMGGQQQHVGVRGQGPSSPIQEEEE